MVLMVLLRPAAFPRNAALQRLAHSHFLHAQCKAAPTVAFRAFSSDVPPPDAPPAAATPIQEKPKQEKPLTNKKIWDRVLSNHPEQHDTTHGDLLYEYSRKTYFGFMGAGSLAHIAFWSWFKGYEQSIIEMMPQAPEPSLFSFLTADFGSSLGFGSSILLAFLVGFHGRRTVARISVVAGGDKLRITTHKFFGDMGEPFDVPVANVSANPNMKKIMILKLGKDRGFYLVDIDGNFYNRKKLESLITFRTDFSEHEKMMKEKDKGKIISIRTDLPRTELTSEAPSDRQATLPKRIAYSKTKGNLLGRKPNKPVGKK